MTTLTDLIERLEKATEGSQSLDKDVSRFDTREPQTGPLRHYYTRRMADASLLLGPGRKWEAFSEDNWMVSVYVRTVDSDGDIVGAATHRSAEIALVLAALKARAT